MSGGGLMIHKGGGGEGDASGMSIVIVSGY